MTDQIARMRIMMENEKPAISRRPDISTLGGKRLRLIVISDGALNSARSSA
ncbi:hypothetical protein V5F63_14710 [Xanthobacter autotrophicus DSM 597]|uniref:hypothetical protein n=1 Tax=Xanthobacter wiegelii TaxID=3119913 RepID=UPI00372A8669